MDNQVSVLTFKQLKKIVADLEQNEQVTDETKIFIDTGWDSVQEVEPTAFHVEDVRKFEVVDELTKEVYSGFALKEKAERVNAFGEAEAAIILRNLY